MNVRGLLAQLRIELVLTLRRGESLLVTLLIPVQRQEPRDEEVYWSVADQRLRH